jgi:hypothetical protein
MNLPAVDAIDNIEWLGLPTKPKSIIQRHAT